MQFVVVDLDQRLPKAHKQIVNKYFDGFIPKLVVLDRRGQALYNHSGEVEEQKISALLEKTLKE